MKIKKQRSPALEAALRAVVDRAPPLTAEHVTKLRKEK